MTAPPSQPIRIPARLLAFIESSKDYADWLAGRGCLQTDRALFVAIRDANVHERHRADGSLHVHANPALRATLHQWAVELTYERGPDEDERRANVRSARSVIRQVS